MKTIIIEEIDGYNIIKSVNPADGMIDPVKTKNKVDLLLKETEIFKDIQELKSGMGAFVHKEKQAFKNASKKSIDAATKQKYMIEVEAARSAIKEIMEQLKPLAEQLQNEFKKLMTEHAEYFQLKDNEKYIDDTEAEEITALMQEAISEGCLLSELKEKIKDNRGKKYWKLDNKVWSNVLIENLGEEPEADYILESDLTPEQKTEIAEQLEIKRILSMTKDDKDKEKNAILDGLLNEAANMKSKLEIQGDVDALVKSQDWLAVETDKIELKYG